MSQIGGIPINSLPLGSARESSPPDQKKVVDGSVSRINASDAHAKNGQIKDGAFNNMSHSSTDGTRLAGKELSSPNLVTALVFDTEAMGLTQKTSDANGTVVSRFPQRTHAGAADAYQKVSNFANSSETTSDVDMPDDVENVT